MSANYIKLFSNYGKTPNVEYICDIPDDNETIINEEPFDPKAIFRNLIDNNNLREESTLTSSEIKPFLNCLKPKRVESYEDWKRIGICLHNMDYRNQVSCWGQKTFPYLFRNCY